jgi:hypothetical protein
MISLMPPITMTKARYLSRQSLPPLDAVSATGRRSISHGGIGDTEMSDNRYWNGR